MKRFYGAGVPIRRNRPHRLETCATTFKNLLEQLLMSLRLTLNPEKNPLASLRLGVINCLRQGAKAQRLRRKHSRTVAHGALATNKL
jgi:hypothetical protein